MTTIKNIPLVSILVIISRCDFLQAFFESIIKQTLDQWEMILFINGLSRKDKIFVQELLANYKITKIKICFHRKVGVGIARKKIFELAICPYLLPVDDDDMLMPTAIESIIKCFMKHPKASIVRAGKIFIGEKTKYSNKLIRIVSKMSCYPLQRMQMYGMTMDIDNIFQLYCVNTAIFKKAAELTTYPDYKHVGEDLDLFLKLEELGEIVWIKKILYLKRKHASNVLKRFSKNKLILLERRYVRNAIRRRGLPIKISSIEPLARIDVDGVRRYQYVFRYKKV